MIVRRGTKNFFFQETRKKKNSYRFFIKNFLRIIQSSRRETRLYRKFHPYWKAQRQCLSNRLRENMIICLDVCTKQIVENCACRVTRNAYPFTVDCIIKGRSFICKIRTMSHVLWISLPPINQFSGWTVPSIRFRTHSFRKKQKKKKNKILAFHRLANQLLNYTDYTVSFLKMEIWLTSSLARFLHSFVLVRDSVHLCASTYFLST